MNLPHDLLNLVFKFSYGMSIEQLGKNAFIAEVHSRNLNVPKTWKKLITSNNLFNWTKFSDSPDIQLIQLKQFIDLKAVRETVKSLNWRYLKKQHILSCCLAKQYKKREVLRILHFWTKQTVRFLYQIQSILLSVDLCDATCSKSNPHDLFLKNQMPMQFCLFG